METRKQVLWMSAVVLAVAAIAVATSTPDDEPAPPQAAEPDLFSFIKAPESMHAGRSDATVDPAGNTAATETAPVANQDVPAEYAGKPTPTQVAETEQAVRDMRARGASDDEVYRARAAALSPEGAAQLARMELEESAWRARVNAYLAEKNAFIGNNPQTGQTQYAMQQLRNARFTPEEQTQLDAYELSSEPRLVQE